jgi:hypothetical protein
MDGNYIFFSVLFSIIGMAYFSYGRKQNIYFMVFGIVLMIYPYAVEQLTSLIVVGIILTALPFILNRFLPL